MVRIVKDCGRQAAKFIEYAQAKDVNVNSGFNGGKFLL